MNAPSEPSAITAAFGAGGLNNLIPGIVAQALSGYPAGMDDLTKVVTGVDIDNIGYGYKNMSLDLAGASVSGLTLTITSATPTGNPGQWSITASASFVTSYSDWHEYGSRYTYKDPIPRKYDVRLTDGRVEVSPVTFTAVLTVSAGTLDGAGQLAVEFTHVSQTGITAAVGFPRSSVFPGWSLFRDLAGDVAKRLTARDFATPLVTGLQTLVKTIPDTGLVDPATRYLFPVVRPLSFPAGGLQLAVTGRLQDTSSNLIAPMQPAGIPYPPVPPDDRMTLYVDPVVVANMVWLRALQGRFDSTRPGPGDSPEQFDTSAYRFTVPSLYEWAPDASLSVAIAPGGGDAYPALPDASVAPLWVADSAALAFLNVPQPVREALAALRARPFDSPERLRRAIESRLPPTEFASWAESIVASAWRPSLTVALDMCMTVSARRQGAMQTACVIRTQPVYACLGIALSVNGDAQFVTYEVAELSRAFTVESSAFPLPPAEVDALWIFLLQRLLGDAAAAFSRVGVQGHPIPRLHGFLLHNAEVTPVLTAPGHPAYLQIVGQNGVATAPIPPDAPLPPPTTVQPAVNWWAQKCPFNGEPQWDPGYRVRYGVQWVTARRAGDIGAWNEPPLDGEHWQYTLPNLTIPLPPSRNVVLRRVWRHFDGRAVEVVGEVTDPTATTFQDEW